MRLKIALLAAVLFLSSPALAQTATATGTGTGTATSGNNTNNITVGGGSSTPNGPITSSGGTSTSSQTQGVATSGNSYNSYVNSAQRRNPVSTAYAAPLTATGDCMGSTSAGGQAIGFGLSLGSTWHDTDCERRHDAAALHNMGFKSAAISLMCQNDAVAEAMKTAGTPCRSIGKKPIKTTADANRQEYQEIHKPIDKN